MQLSQIKFIDKILEISLIVTFLFRYKYNHSYYLMYYWSFDMDIR